MPRIHSKRLLTIIMALIALGNSASIATAQSGPTDGISTITGLHVAPADETKTGTAVFLGTEFGLLHATPDGISRVAGDRRISVSALTGISDDPNTILISGLGADGKPVGVLKTSDGGSSWQNLTDAQFSQPFRKLVASPVTPTRLAALTDKLHLSQDSGQTWVVQGTLPKQTFSVAFSATEPDTLYAANMAGLLRSSDLGKTWSTAFAKNKPTTLVKAFADGRVMAFVYGVGLYVALEPDFEWQLLSDEFEDRYMLNLVNIPNDPLRMFATVDTGAILISPDAGRNWHSFEGSDKLTAQRLAEGQVVFEENCQICHGVSGIGEAPGDPAARDEFGPKAPALNDDMHAWHHSDANLKATIQQGSPRNPRMTAFQETLTQDEIDNVIVYVKSLWSVRSLACQGGRHMTCMGN